MRWTAEYDGGTWYDSQDTRWERLPPKGLKRLTLRFKRRKTVVLEGYAAYALFERPTGTNHAFAYRDVLTNEGRYVGSIRGWKVSVIDAALPSAPFHLIKRGHEHDA